MASRINQNLFRLDCNKKFWDQTFSVNWLRASTLNQLAFSHLFFSFCRRFRFSLASYSWQVFNTFVYINFFAWRSYFLFLNKHRMTRWGKWRLRKLLRNRKLKKYQKYFYKSKSSVFFFSQINGLTSELNKSSIPTNFKILKLWKFFKIFRLTLNLNFTSFLKTKFYNLKINSLTFFQDSLSLITESNIYKSINFNNKNTNFFFFYNLKLFKKNLYFNRFFVKSCTRFLKKNWYLHLFWQFFLSIHFSFILNVKTYCHVFDIVLTWGSQIKKTLNSTWDVKFFKGIERKVFKFLQYRENFVLKNLIFNFYFTYLTRSLNSLARYLLFIIERWKFKRQGLIFKFLRKLFVDQVFNIYLPSINGNTFFPWIYLTFKGRINGKHRARTFVFNKKNSKPCAQNLLRDVDFCKFQASTNYGTYGIKIWAYYDKSLKVKKK